MSAVVLSRKLVLETRQRTPDGAGGQSEEWVALGELWAALVPKRGALRARGDLSLAEGPTEIVVRGATVGDAARPRPRQRFRMGERVWHILAVREADPKGRYLTCDTIEEAAP